MLAKLPLAERISVRAQDRSLMYVLGAGGDADIDGEADEEAMVTNLGFPLVFPFDFGCPSIPPPFLQIGTGQAILKFELQHDIATTVEPLQGLPNTLVSDVYTLRQQGKDDGSSQLCIAR